MGPSVCLAGRQSGRQLVSACDSACDSDCDSDCDSLALLREREILLPLLLLRAPSSKGAPEKRPTRLIKRRAPAAPNSYFNSILFHYRAPVSLISFARRSLCSWRAARAQRFAARCKCGPRKCGRPRRAARGQILIQSASSRRPPAPADDNGTSDSSSIDKRRPTGARQLFDSMPAAGEGRAQASSGPPAASHNDQKERADGRRPANPLTCSNFAPANGCRRWAAPWSCCSASRPGRPGGDSPAGPLPRTI